MMKIYTAGAILLLFIVTSCDEPGSYSNITEENKTRLQQWAGVLARYNVLHPDDPLRPELPSEEDFASILLICESQPEAWSYFYSAMAETISTIEPPEPECQIEIETYDESEIGSGSL